ncbi:MAG: DUF1501 domain-containing protein [Planctomycetota bacterium]
MLNIGSFDAQSCSGVSRRAFLRAGTALPFVLPAVTTGLAGANVLAPGVARASSPLRGRAKSTIFVWLWGAPSHIDTIDPKPDAVGDVRGPFATIATRTPGLQFTELLPKLANRSDLFTVVRSHVTFSGGHPDAGTWGLTGFDEKPTAKANFGSIVARHRGTKGTLPPYAMIGRGLPRDVVRKVEGCGGGPLGSVYNPFLLGCDEMGQVEIPSLKLLDGLVPSRLHDRWQLLETLDQTRRSLDADKNNWRQRQLQAYQLLTRAEARQALDLTSESAQVRESYGQTSFGQSCLLARRLVEAEVPYIHVNWSEYVEAVTPNTDFGWDTHIFNFDLLPDRLCPIFDRAFTALLNDLAERRLLDSTLVVAIGEFGRTPKINKRASRDHWQRCYSSIWAGAGIEPGRVIGASDRNGEDPITTPITPLMVGTTIAELAGLDTQARAELQVLDGGSVIHELIG